MRPREAEIPAFGLLEPAPRPDWREIRDVNDHVRDQPSLFGAFAPALGALEPISGSPEAFALNHAESTLIRSVTTRTGDMVASSVSAGGLVSGVEDPAAWYDAAWLRSSSHPTLDGSSDPPVRLVDLFSGCGGLTLGVMEACRALGRSCHTLLAVDMNVDALATYVRNFKPDRAHDRVVEELVDRAIGAPLSQSESRVAAELGKVDLLIGGPPCQGHSNLNNHTRRSDPKNLLYLRMARFAEVVRPTHIIIENVPGVVHDRSGVVQETWSALTALGYSVDTVLLRSERLGVAQRRHRFFTVASLSLSLDLNRQVAKYYRPGRSLRWAIEDLLSCNNSRTFDSAAKHSPANASRIDFLFDNDLYDLPDEHRPDCHRLKTHSYRAVYGRLRWDESAPTITTGFGSTGQGRFVHPKLRRTLTPHEAARLQFIPDFFHFGDQGRRALQEMIGNAVPPKLAYVLALELLR
jgi:DNA (cytosine-5)-methyltransferase 1